MRISDWSSDVCSSDLRRGGNARRREFGNRFGARAIDAPMLHDHAQFLAIVAAQYVAGVKRVIDEFGAFHEFGPAREDRPADDLRDDPAVAGPEQIGRPRTEAAVRSEEHTSELQSLMRITYAVFCLK